MAGRPTKLNPAVQQKIVDAILAGNYLEVAATFGGVDYATFRVWMNKGEKATSGQYHDFRDAVLAAESMAEVRMVAQWAAAMPKNWQAVRDFLARRHPARWGAKDNLDVTTKGESLQPTLTAEQVEARILSIMQAAALRKKALEEGKPDDAGNSE
jgi:transposase